MRALVLCLLLGAMPLTVRGQTTVLRAARLLDGRGGAPLQAGMVIIDGERITAVGTGLRVPAGATVIDLGDATLLPGLIDLHTHLTSTDGHSWEDELVTTTPGEAALFGARNARRTLLAGFTTVRDMGPTWPYVDVDLKRAIERGVIEGPRMLVAGNYVSATGGAGDARQFSVYVDVPIVQNLADGVDEIRKVVRTNQKYGADFTKILVTGAVFSRGIEPGAQQYSDEEIRTAVIETERWGHMVAAHAHGVDGIKAAIRAGVRTIDHGSYLDDEAIAMLKASGSTWYVPTLATNDFVRTDPDDEIREAQLARSRAIKEIKDAAFRRALAAGLPIGYATDAVIVPHGRNAYEMIVRNRLGEAPMSTIVSATSLNATILGWEDRIGSLEAGKLADIIAVPGNPLADIAVMERVSFVMKGGVVVRTDGAPKRTPQ